MKTARYVWIYEDESGERFRQLFLDAENKRKKRNKELRTIGMCLIIGSIFVGLVFLKLYSMGAVVGIK